MDTFQIDPLIGNIYDGVMAADGLQKFVDRLVDQFELKAAMLFTHNVLNGEVKGMWQRGMERRWMESYAIEYGREDLLAQHMANADIGNFYASNIHLSETETTTSRFYREWIVPQGVGYAAGAVILKEGIWATQVILQRSPVHPPFDVQELKALGQLIAHLQRAVQMRHRFTELRAGQTLLTAGLDVLAMPSIVMDEWGAVVHVNIAAGRLLNRENNIWIEDRHLRTNRFALTKQISLEVILAIDISRGSASTVPGVVVIPREGRMPLTLVVTPMYTAESPLKGAALVLLHDPSAGRSAKPELLEQMFMLSSAEAELVIALCDGQTLEEAARSRHTSLHTVRSQLKSIFNKTGTHRQADLVTLVLSSPAYFVAST